MNQVEITNYYLLNYNGILFNQVILFNNIVYFYSEITQENNSYNKIRFFD